MSHFHHSGERLQQLFHDMLPPGSAPLVVSRHRSRFEVRLQGTAPTSVPIITGRFEIVYAWLKGYCFAVAPVVAVDEVENAPCLPVRDVVVD